MDFDISTQSVRSALSDLQLKVKLLEDERDHFHHLFLTTSRAFEDHRRELTLLLQRERSISAASEEKMRLDLQRVLSENTLLHSQVVESKTESAARTRHSVEEFQSEQRLREEKIRAQIAAVHDELLAARRRCNTIREEKRTVDATMTAMLQQQTQLQTEVTSLQEQRMELEEQLTLDDINDQRARRSPQRPCRTASEERRLRVKKVFLPSGPVDVSNKRPSTHHIHAVVNTLEKQSQLLPRHCDVTRSGKQLDSVCKTMISELLEMKREYSRFTDQLGDPLYDSVEISRRLRQLMYDIDRKTEQLRHLRRQQLRIDDDIRIHEMLKEITDEQGIYEGMHEALLKILRCTSS